MVTAEAAVGWFVLPARKWLSGNADEDVLPGAVRGAAVCGLLCWLVPGKNIILLGWNKKADQLLLLLLLLVFVLFFVAHW